MCFVSLLYQGVFNRPSATAGLIGITGFNLSKRQFLANWPIAVRRMNGKAQRRSCGRCYYRSTYFPAIGSQPSYICACLAAKVKMRQRWTRPKSVPFPSVWSRFDGRKEINGVKPKFWIQDIPEDQFETVTDIMANQFLRDEPLCKYSKLASEKQSVDEFCELWRDVLQDRVGLICYMENPDPTGKPIIASINCTHVVCKGSNFAGKPKGIQFAKLLATVDYLSHMKDSFEELGVDSFLNAMGLYVLPDFRGQGLGLEMLKAREPMCRAVGIKATITVFSATAAQILAARVGFKDLSVISYADLEKMDPKLRYPGIEAQTKCVKYMYVLYK